MIEYTLDELKNQHSKLSRFITKFQRRPGYDSLELKRLKTKRANLKIQIVALGGQTLGMTRDHSVRERRNLEKSGFA
jgi:hypothetical protein